VESGSFDELLACRGLFTAMAARQSIFPQAAAV
jgi:ABC-type multidrug transport system fused ATPase/permease subunit